MYRNINSRFAEVPQIDKPRSKFNRTTGIKFSGNVGDLIPFYVEEILPGDTVQVKTSLVARLQTLVAPIMDNLYLDTFYFYVPSRILWNHWKEFNGENTSSKWIPDTVYSIPQIEAPEGGWNVGTIADYLGIPTGISNISVNALPFRAYAMICNEFFRDQNNTDYLDIPFGDSTVTGVNTDTFITDVAKGGKPFKAAKYHDYFTSALPSPLKGDAVRIPLSDTGTFPVIPGPASCNYDLLVNASNSDAHNITYTRFSVASDPRYHGSVTDVKTYGVAGSDISAPNTMPDGSFPGISYDSYNVSTDGTGTLDVAEDLTMIPDNLVATVAPVSATINDLRLSFSLQHMLELDARGGTRYREMLLSHFGVHSPDARQNVPEYLGGSHIPININQVVQTSGEVGNTPQGNVAAYSVTSDVSGDFIKSFTEHGYIIGVCCIRYDHTYQQGLSRMWTRRKRTDFYLPVFANLGEQPVYNRELYCTGTSTDDEIFGYQECWAEYRYSPSRIAGELRSQYAQSLDVWHLGDYYNSLPVLQSDWIFEDKANLDRCLQVSSAVSNQFWADFYIDADYTRVMPMFSIPGLKTL